MIDLQVLLWFAKSSFVTQAQVVAVKMMAPQLGQLSGSFCGVGITPLWSAPQWGQKEYLETIIDISSIFPPAFVLTLSYKSEAPQLKQLSDFFCGLSITPLSLGVRF